MLGEMHDLMHEFPEYADKIREMHKDNAAFAALMDQYDDLDAQVRRLEEMGQPVADETLEQLKFKRLALKDRLFAMLHD